MREDMRERLKEKPGQHFMGKASACVDGGEVGLGFVA